MDYITLVTLIKWPNYAVEDIARQLLLQEPIGHDAVEEFATLQHLHHELEALCIFLPLEQFDDVGVVEALEDF